MHSGVVYCARRAESFENRRKSFYCHFIVLIALDFIIIIIYYWTELFCFIGGMFYEIIDYTIDQVER